MIVFYNISSHTFNLYSAFQNKHGFSFSEMYNINIYYNIFMSYISSLELDNSMWPSLLKPS